MYNYVQHDNEFCLTCHLMADPYDRFARSQHRDLGCKACHQPTPVTRAKMALTQIVENPDTLVTHAEVPNERCEECHVKGNPRDWQIISKTAGHRVHLESNSPTLQGLQCVECHSTSLHEFSTTDKTCGQSGCHEGVTIQLGKMSKLTLHCAACHDFSRPVRQAGDAQQVADGTLLQPQAQDCLACHAMRQRVQMPANDPHNGECGACHNPHEQKTPSEAVKSCANAGCHEKAETVTPMHRGLSVGQFTNCTSCHKAHEFRIGTSQCVNCHRAMPETPAFPHARHRAVACAECHATEGEHGAVKVTSPQQCQACHHTTQVARNCTACHAANEFAARKYASTQRLTVAGKTKSRELAFDHRQHNGVACAQCHTDPMSRNAAQVQCKACHTDHHKATQNCMACHPRATGVHTRNVHVGCAGSSCHKQLPAAIANVPHTRQFCLTCHQNMVAHQPRGNCADCHKLPAPGSATQ